MEHISFSIPLSELDKTITKIGKVFIHKMPESIKVYDAHCTHMGCVLNFNEDEQKFMCPCHSSEFSLEGKRLKGPARRDLDIIKSEVANNILRIG